MIRYETQRDRYALLGALLMLEQIAKRSTDRSSRTLAAEAAGELRACVEARILCDDTETADTEPPIAP